MKIKQISIIYEHLLLDHALSVEFQILIDEIPDSSVFLSVFTSKIHKLLNWTKTRDQSLVINNY